jgi:hypothetical protein
MYLLVIAFLLLAIAVLVGSHMFVYGSLIKFFDITNNQTRIILAIVIGCLGLSFFISSILAHLSDNIITRALYFGAGTWLGLGINLIIGFVIAGIITWIFKITGIKVDLKILGTMAVIFAVFFSTYGIWNSYHPRIKNITVKIKDLPIAWQGKKVAQISVVHLGHVFGWTFMARLVEQINEQKPDLVFITGDLFDGMDGSVNLGVEPIGNLKAPAYFVTGNHETYFGLDRIRQILSETKIQALNDELIIIDGLQIVGISYPDRDLTKDVAKAINNLPNFDRNQPTILLYHSPAQEDTISKTGVDLQLSGHTHRGQLWPLSLITRFVYHGFDYGLRQVGDMTLYVSSGAGGWGPTMRTAQAPEITIITLEIK